MTKLPFRLNTVTPVFISALTLALAVSPLQAAAAETSKPTNTNVEEVIVTATKRDQRLEDVPSAVSVIRDFEQIKSLNDIAQQVPGLFVVDAGARNPNGIIIRGLRTDAVKANDLGGDGSSVASYIDNIPLQGFFAPPDINLKDLQQVEVLRGPQGTLYGNASIGGLVRYVTAKPNLEKWTTKVSAELSSTAHSHDLNYDNDLIINMPIIESELGARLLLSQTKNAGFIDNYYLLSGPQADINQDKTDQARLSLLWQPTSEFAVNGSYHYQKVHAADRQAANPDFTGSNYNAASRYLQPMDGKLSLASIDSSYDFDFAVLTASASKYKYKSTSSADQTDYLLLLDEYYYDNSYYSTYPDFSAITESDLEVKKDSAEIRLASPDTQALRWLVGAFYSKDDLTVAIADSAPGFADFTGENRPYDLDYLAGQAEELKENSVYGEATLDITDQWQVTLGARHFRYKDTAAACSLFFPLADDTTDFPFDCTPAYDDQSGNLGKFSTQFRFSDSSMMYVSIAEGYRRGGANFLPTDIDHHRGYKPDTTVNYELGARNAWLDNKLQLTTSLFYIDWKNVQIPGYIEEGYGVTLNSARANSQGIEIEATAELNDYFSLDASFAHTIAELSKTTADIDGMGATGYSGDRLPGSPATQWHLGVNYNQPLLSALMEAKLSLNGQSDVYTALNNEFSAYDRLDGFTTANASVDVILRNWRAGVFVNNIGNTRGITGKRTNEWYGEQGKFEYITRPRTIGLSLSYEF